MSSSLKPRSFKLSETTIENLRQISQERGNTLSGTLRQLILQAYEHQILGIPRCASGNPCLVPATWEQHIALRQLAEARAEMPEMATSKTSLETPTLPGQTDLAPQNAARADAGHFLHQF